MYHIFFLRLFAPQLLWVHVSFCFFGFLFLAPYDVHVSPQFCSFLSFIPYDVHAPIHFSAVCPSTPVASMCHFVFAGFCSSPPMASMRYLHFLACCPSPPVMSMCHLHFLAWCPSPPFMSMSPCVISFFGCLPLAPLRRSCVATPYDVHVSPQFSGLCRSSLITSMYHLIFFCLFVPHLL